MKQRRSINYWVLVGLSYCLAAIPYLWSHLIPDRWVVSASGFIPFAPVPWWAAAAGVIWFLVTLTALALADGRSRWVLLPSAAIFFWPGLLWVFAFLVWEIRGFAP